MIGVIMPRRLRADWRREWEAKLRYREMLLVEWDKLDWRNKLDLLRRSPGRVPEWPSNDEKLWKKSACVCV